jgi:hypothetical protein
VEKAYKVVHGIKLYQRTCSVCGVVEFWVPKSSKQKTCGMFCEIKKRGAKTAFLKKTSKVFKDKVKRSDYEDR